VQPPVGVPGARPPGLPPQGGVPPQGGQFQGGQVQGGQLPPPPGGPGQPPRSGPRIGPGGAAAIGLGAGIVGGVLAGQAFRRLDDVRGQRREFNEGGVTYIQEPGRVIERDNGRAFIRHDENERFRDLGYDVRTEQRGDEYVSVFDRGDGVQIVTVTDADGRLIRRYRRFRDGREVVIIDNGPPRSGFVPVVVLPPPPLAIPREEYILDADQANEGAIYDTLVAPPVAPLPRRYTLDEVRASYDLRARMRSVDLDTINFDTGSWTVSPDQASRLAKIADALQRAIQRNPNEVFLVEGHTDAVGSDVDNLSLSDRRAQSVAAILTQDFRVPAENLTTQGYGEQYLKVQTSGPSRENRRVTIRRITPLLDQK